jgi:hypothetical protein
MYKHKKIKKYFCERVLSPTWLEVPGVWKSAANPLFPQLFTAHTISLAAYIHHFSAITIIMEEKSIENK